MDTMSYRSVIEKLDQQIAAAKVEAAKKTRKEELDRKLKLIDHWVQGLQSRKAELAQYGVAPEIDVDTEIRKLSEERLQIESEFSGNEVGPMADGPRVELDTLIREVDEMDLKDSEPEERWAVYGNWACRWRFLVDKVGQAVVDRERAFAKCFARIRERMNQETVRGPFIIALDPKAEADWSVKLAESEAELRKIETQKRGQDAAEAAVFELMGTLQKYHLPEDPEGVRKLRHHVRLACRFPHIREEVAELVLGHKDLLRPEFSYLWEKPQADEPAPSRKLSRRELIYRVLRNMKSKGLIGACHGPYERISSSGFPGHDLGRAKEAVAILVRCGIIRKKPSVIGSRISIEPKAVGAVEGFLKTNVMEITEVDAWCLVED